MSFSAINSTRLTATVPPQSLVLIIFVLVLGLLIGGRSIEEVVKLVEFPLLIGELRLGEFPVSKILNQPLKFFYAALKGTHEGIGGAGETALKDTHRQTRGGTI